MSTDIVINKIPITPPWLLARPVVNLELQCYDKSSTSPDLFKSKFFEIRHSFRDYYELYTDGSKDGNRGNRIGALRPISKHITKTSRLADIASIFTAELYAIVLAYMLVYRKPRKQFIVFSYSSSALQAIKNFDVNNHLLMHIVGEHLHPEKSGKHVELCWIPSHIGIIGNEKADDAAKAVLYQHITFLKLPAPDFYPSISQYCSSEWQVSWDSCTSNKLRAIIPVVGSNVMKKNLNRRDSSALNRVQLGHTRLTHSHLLSGELPPVCCVCQIPLTVQHFMLDCLQFTVKRAKCFAVSSLKDLFHHVNAHVMVDFIQDIGFYNHL